MGDSPLFHLVSSDVLGDLLLLLSFCSFFSNANAL